MLCNNHVTIQSTAGIQTTAVRSSIESALATLRAVERTSLMSRKARHCMEGFLKVFDSLRKWNRKCRIPSHDALHLVCLSETLNTSTDSRSESSPTNTSNAHVSGFTGTAALHPSSIAPGALTADNCLAQFVTQSADDFLFQCSDSGLLDADLDFLRSFT